MIDLGKHGTLEWLPGKALALSAECFPEAVLGPLPHLYPFIVNDPGEGTQAKRRAQAVIVDHLTPPLTRAGSYGDPAELERLIDEYYEAARGDPRRVAPLAAEILERARAAGIDRDCGIAQGDERAEALRKLDGFLCELKELQIRDGLHVFGASPAGELLDALLLAIARPGARSRATRRIAAARAGRRSRARRRPARCWSLAEPWTGRAPRGARQPRAVAHRRRHRRTAGGLWRCGWSRARQTPDAGWRKTHAVLGWIERQLRPAVVGCGEAEIAGLLAGLDGRFVPPGPSGAPSRGRPEVLPTGRNFYSLDTRAVPTPAAWQLGWHSAGLLVERHAQEHGNYPARIALSAWGTANMRTGGDDIAQALGADRRAPGLGAGERPGHRVRDPAGGRARPAAGRCDLAHLRILPRRVPRPDRPVRQRRARGRRARRAGRRSTRSPRASPPTGGRSKPARRRKTPRAAPATASSARSPAPTAPGCRR